MSKIYKKIDDLGRIVLPISFRRNLGIKAHDRVMLELNGSTITIELSHIKCALCGEKIEENQDLKLCEKCVNIVKSYK